MTAYYNEIDPKKAEWLRILIAAGHIAKGVVDERSIQDVLPSDLDGFIQCHFFAGIGVWSYALRLAGWPDDRPVWTGSCPCQSFSLAGKGEGFDDKRHLWPAWYWLIQQCRPHVIFGEQVANGIAKAWLDLVCTDLENDAFTVGTISAAAGGFGAPHARMRTYFVADGSNPRLEVVGQQPTREERATSFRGRAAFSVAKPHEEQPHGGRDTRARGRVESTNRRHHGELGDTDCVRPEQPAREGARPGEAQNRGPRSEPTESSTARGFWGDCDWLYCRDGKCRPVESGTFPLAHGSPERVVRLRGYGDAIVAPQAAEFIKAYKEVTA